MFLSRGQDLDTDCSCPDWSNPCEHIAAVCLPLGEEFDQDPFLISRLRGIEQGNWEHRCYPPNHCWRQGRLDFYDLNTEDYIPSLESERRQAGAERELRLQAEERIRQSEGRLHRSGS